MENSKVYVIDMRAGNNESFIDKLGKLLATCGIETIIKENDLTAVKIHFGEKGNSAYIRPVYIRKIIEELKRYGAVPFLTDANTLYVGSRSDAPNHTTTTIQNGFSYSTVEAPIVIADGLRGKSETVIPINKKHCKEIYIGKEIMEADAFISVAHFKGHEMSGFGGAIKNTGMGCASRRGKLDQHSSVSPTVDAETCISCGECISSCNHQAITIDSTAHIDSEKCVGCGYCILICPQHSIGVQWNQSIPVFMEKMVEYTYGLLRDRKEKSLFINFITDVSPGCDCYGFNDAPIVRNIGVLASRDPIALDQACADLVNKEPALPGSSIENTPAGADKFKAVYPHIDWTIQLTYAEELGVGSRSYTLIPVK